MRIIRLLILLMICSCTAQAQREIKFHIPATSNGSDLRGKFRKHDLYKVDIKSTYWKIEEDTEKNIELNFSEKHKWTFTLEESELLSSNYIEIVAAKDGSRKRTTSVARTYSGILKGGEGRISLSIDQDFFSAVIVEGGQTWYVEQTQYLNGETDGEVVVMYNVRDVIAGQSGTCGVENTEQRVRTFLDEKEGMRALEGGCKVVDLAIASDESMLLKYGSASAVFNHNIAVMNNVAVLFRHEFNDNIEFRIVGQYLSEAKSQDPLTPATDSGDPTTLLWSFSAWAEAGNFEVAHTLGQFWTNRDFSGSAVGIAWVNSICTTSAYHALQDYGGNMASMGVLAAHEIAHNFGANHDASGSPTIMAPSVNQTTTWSGASKSAVNNQLSSRSCFTGCSGPVLPDFVITPGAACVDQPVLFKDKSVNGETRQWAFPSGNPANSTLSQVGVRYNLPGIYDVSLTANVDKFMHAKGRIVVSDVALSQSSCPVPSGNPGTGGIRYFGLNDMVVASNNAALEGTKYVDRSCSKITELTPNTMYNLTISLGKTDAGSAVYEFVNIYIDYNGDGVFNETNELVVVSQAALAGYFTSESAAYSWLGFTTATQVTKNKILRLRIVTDTTRPVGACHNPVNGQVEDYGVVFREPNRDTALPVDLMSFTGRSLEAHNLLQWRTVNESGISMYRLMRSVDGKGFKEIGEIVSKNTGKDQNLYALTDNELSGAVEGYYYKIQIEGQDGKVDFSRIVYIKNIHYRPGLVLENCQTFIVGNDISYDLISNTRRPVTVNLLDIQGKRVKTWEKQLVDGTNHMLDDVSGLRSGIMFLYIQSLDQAAIVQKILK